LLLVVVDDVPPVAVDDDVAVVVVDPDVVAPVVVVPAGGVPSIADFKSANGTFRF